MTWGTTPLLAPCRHCFSALRLGDKVVIDQGSLDGGWVKGRVSGSEPEGWLALDFLSSRAKELVARSSATTANNAAAATSAAARTIALGSV